MLFWKEYHDSQVLSIWASLRTTVHMCLWLGLHTAYMHYSFIFLPEKWPSIYIELTISAFHSILQEYHGFSGAFHLGKSENDKIFYKVSSSSIWNCSFLKVSSWFTLPYHCFSTRYELLYPPIINALRFQPRRVSLLCWSHHWEGLAFFWNLSAAVGSCHLALGSVLKVWLKIPNNVSV